MANGITQITNYEANDWLASLSFNTISPPINSSRIANDSWVGNGNDVNQSGLILRLADRQTNLNELIQVVGWQIAKALTHC